MNSLKSISKSVSIIKKHKTPLCLMHCTNIYPTPPKLINLGDATNDEKFPSIPIGLSDHSKVFHQFGRCCVRGILIEKHFTYSKKLKVLIFLRLWIQ